VWKTKKVDITKAMGLNALALILLGVEEDENERERGHRLRKWWHSEEEVERMGKKRVRLSLKGEKATLV